eukprot:1048914-Rhodomonas_salina.3
MAWRMQTRSASTGQRIAQASDDRSNDPRCLDSRQALPPNKIDQTVPSLEALTPNACSVPPTKTGRARVHALNNQETELPVVSASLGARTKGGRRQ